jgi:hypothetical protein
LGLRGVKAHESIIDSMGKKKIPKAKSISAIWNLQSGIIND